jgi:Leucine-rich repeat (LRR) protein
MSSRTKLTSVMWLTAALTMLLMTSSKAYGQCPWSRDGQLVNLQSACVCNSSENKGFNALSIQCQAANFPMLMSALRSYTSDTILENLYISNTTIGSLTDFLFKNLKIINLHLNSCNIITISENAFRGLENTLQNLNLASNDLRSIPVLPLRTLRLLSQLDLSTNQIKYVPDNAFVTLRLKTLKMAENNITMSDNALRGLEISLKNLNLKGCQLKEVPSAIRGLKGLAFLDLAQNNLRVIEPGNLQRLDSLTALNLERNVIQKLHKDVFDGVNDTLSSLSMLNNLLTEFPLEAIRSLPELRVSEQQQYCWWLQKKKPYGRMKWRDFNYIHHCFCNPSKAFWGTRVSLIIFFRGKAEKIY